MKFLKKNVFLHFVNSLVIDHPTPVNISYLWNFGSLAGLLLVSQVVSGIFLAMFYVPSVDMAFSSVEHVMRDVNYGWFLRYLHANGASIFFLIVYLHIFRSIYFVSYRRPNSETWLIGVTIYLVMMATAFLGYVLPWGQMSLWAATVITNFFSVVPYIGSSVVTWLWGGFSVNNATLNRFYSLHFLLPFILLGLMFLHLVALHETGHSNPLGLEKYRGKNSNAVDAVSFASFFPFFIVKDLVGALALLCVLIFFVCFAPNFFGHPDNYIQANPLLTPSHIVPEWYFLPFYAILRSVPNKTIGVLLMLCSILILYLLPVLERSRLGVITFRPVRRISFWFFVIVCVLLGWVGGNPIEAPFYRIGQVATFLYFFYFVAVVPYLALVERQLLAPQPTPPWAFYGYTPFQFMAYIIHVKRGYVSKHGWWAKHYQFASKEYWERRREARRHPTRAMRRRHARWRPFDKVRVVDRITTYSHSLRRHVS